MPTPPPAPIRWLVLLTALTLLVAAVCAKSETTNQPPVSHPRPSEEAPIAPEKPKPATESDGGLVPAPATQQQATPLPNPPPKKNDKNNKKPTGEKKEPEFFPASKSAGGIF